jgi:transposase
LLEWVNKLHPIEDTQFCTEATGSYHYNLAEFLYNAGLIVSVINPLQIKRFRESKLVRQKTDKSDALVIASFCEQNNPIIWKPKTRETMELTQVNHHINNLKKDLISWKNRLEKNIVVFEVKDSILKKIEELEKEIKIFEEKAKQIINNHQNLSESYRNLTGITGVGERMATTISSEIPDVSNFQNAGQYAAYVGITPSHFQSETSVFQSGTSVRGKSHISRIGNQCVRKTLFMAALVVKQHNKYWGCPR